MPKKENHIQDSNDNLDDVFEENRDTMLSECKNNMDEYFEVISIKSTEALKIKIENMEQVYSMFKNMLSCENESFRKQEHFWVMGLDEKMFVSCVYIVALGEFNYKKFSKSASSVFRLSMFKNATRIILVHYLPKLSLEPYKENLDILNSFYHFNRLFEVAIINYLIMNLESYYDCEANGIIKKVYEDITYKIVYEVKDKIEKEKHEIAIKEREEGVRDGVQKGIEQGWECGQHSKAEEVAREMLVECLDIDLIIKCTGLSKEEIEELE